MFYLLLVFVILHIALDVNYVLRALFTVLTGRVYQKKYSLTDVSTVYGICTFLDCDVSFQYLRDARLVRELDFARYHFYDRTGILHRSKRFKIHSLQGSTLILCQEKVPLFKLYKISTKLRYWDARSLFLEHKVTTLNDGKLRYYLISRQYALSDSGHSTHSLLKGLPGSENKFECPENIKYWLQSNKISSDKMRGLKLM